MRAKFLLFLTIVLLASESESRRQILKGRKVLTRQYLREPALPSWAIVLLVGIGELILGGIFYVIMKKIVLDPPITGSYTPAPTEP